jgi:hypothetical protein
VCFFPTLQSDRGKGQQITAVWQNGGFSANFNGSSSIELLYKTEHLCFDFRHFAKLQTDVLNLLRNGGVPVGQVLSPPNLVHRAAFHEHNLQLKSSQTSYISVFAKCVRACSRVFF